MADDRLVVVPHAPGPLVPLDPPRRGRDDLDDLIDDLFPDTDEGPGPFDALLVALGLGLLGWRLAGGPAVALVGGVAALGLGCVLPVRWLAQRVRRRRRNAIARTGVPLHAGHEATARLVRAYDGLGAAASTAEVAAAHGALLEVATLLRGRPPGSDRERAYVTERAVAIEDLAAAVRDRRPAAAGSAPGGDGAAGPEGPDPALVLDARAELDALTGHDALARLDDLTAEARRRPHAGR